MFTFLFILWLALVTASSLLSLQGVDLDGVYLPFGDKGAHFIFYAGAMLLAMLALWERVSARIPFKKAALWAFGVLFLYGLSIEGLQAVMHMGRTAQAMDVVANTLGLTGGLASAKVVFHALRWLNWKH